MERRADSGCALIASVRDRRPGNVLDPDRRRRAGGYRDEKDRNNHCHDCWHEIHLMRRDAQQRRDALIQAGAECFREFGYGVALEDVADRAGVGRGTLYRNFKDRMALILAIFQREVDRLPANIDPAKSLPEVIAELARAMAPTNYLFARLTSEVSLREENFAAFRILGMRLEELIEPAIAAAKARGEIRATVTGRELVVALRMVIGLLTPGFSDGELALWVDEGVALLMTGLRKS